MATPIFVGGTRAIAAALGLNRETVRRLIRDEGLPAIRVGASARGRFITPIAALRAWIRARGHADTR